MAEYIEREKTIQFTYKNIYHFNGETTLPCVELCLKAVPAADVIPRSVFEQIQYERDLALQTLEEHGIGLGQKAKHGKWACLEQEIGLYACSLCDYRILRVKSTYCPNCGAKIDGKKTENLSDTIYNDFMKGCEK